MTNTIFDLVEADLPEGQEGFMELSRRAPELKDNSWVNTIKDYGKTALKGYIEGTTKLGRMMGPLTEGITTEQQTERLNEILPTNEGFGQKAIRRGLKEAPSMMAMAPAGAVQAGVRSLASGGVGQAIQEVGGPEWLQTVGELATYIGPDIFKGLIEKGSKKEIIEAARKFGMTDEQIAPLLQSEFKLKWLSKFTSRRGMTESALKNSKAGLSNAYEVIKSSPEAIAALPEKSRNALLENMTKIIEDMPSGVRDLLKQDAKDLVSKPITGETLMNFYADINHYLSSGNAKQLSRLKEPIKKALYEVSPQLGKDFEMVNDLYSKYHKIANKLKPNLTTDIIGASEAIGGLFGLVTGNYALLAKVGSEKTIRVVAQQMLLNPKFQQLSEKMVEAINQNKFGIAKKLANSYAYLLREEDPDLSDKLYDMSEEELKDFLTSKENED
jgi:hypothetical protein